MCVHNGISTGGPCAQDSARSRLADSRFPTDRASPPAPQLTAHNPPLPSHHPILHRFTKPTGLYPTCPWDAKAVQRLILDGKLAPRFPGLEEKHKVRVPVFVFVCWTRGCGVTGVAGGSGARVCVCVCVMS